MKISVHTHPYYFVWFKRLSAILALVLPLYFLYLGLTKYSLSMSLFSAIIVDVFRGSLFSITNLVIAYFYQDIAVTEDGLLVEFLWKDLSVSWDKMMEIRPLYVLSAFARGRTPHIVLTNALTPIHRIFGLIYVPSLRPAFIIWPTISEYQSLVETIKKHIKKN